jgi:CheY-like chemotaxis protein
LISNAVKFTEQGTVTIKAFLNPERLLQIEVHDTGIGFPSEEAESIFDKFQQAKHGDTLADRPKGTGLGLSICREIVGRHGGRVWARSEPGAGSVFSITLPAATEGLPVVDGAPLRESGGPAGLGAGQIRQGLGGRPKVLVVDDDPGVRDYLTQLLQEQGWDVLSAENGHAAIAAAKQYRPDLITMDLAMPVMDGRTAIVNLRADMELRNIPIMVISAIPGWESAGGDLAMPKPLDEARFLENSRMLLGGGEGSPSW